jgi:hypothetical protein
VGHLTQTLTKPSFTNQPNVFGQDQKQGEQPRAKQPPGSKKLSVLEADIVKGIEGVGQTNQKALKAKCVLNRKDK